MLDFIVRFWVQELFVLLIALVGFVCKKIKTIAKKQDYYNDGIKALLRSELIKNYNKYTEQRYCPIYAKENVNDIYDTYHNLGGNGVGTKMYNELMDLPTHLKGGSNNEN